jgi:hypothetical protein
MKKIVLFSILATSLLAAPSVQAQMRHGQGGGHHRAMVQNRSRGAWSGSQGHWQAQRIQYRNQRFNHRGFRGANRNYSHSARNWAWGRGQHRGFARNQQPRGWARNNQRAPYQAKGYNRYRQPHRVAAYGPRPGFGHRPQAAYGPGGRNYRNHNRPAVPYRPGARAYEGHRPGFHNSGIPGTIARTSTRPSGTIGNQARGWTHGSGATSGSGWGGHTNSRLSSQPHPQAPTEVTAE